MGSPSFPPIPDTVAGVSFRDKTLLIRALTHSSYLNENSRQVLEDNERLEFLGDAVLNVITAQYLYNRFPEYREGELTRLRAALVRRNALAQMASRINLGSYLMLGHGEEESGGRRRPAILCNAFEAFVGALFLDQGMQRVDDFLQPLIQDILANFLTQDAGKDSRSELQELSQARYQFTPQYRTVKEYGPDHAKEFVVEAYIGEVCAGQGRGPSKQLAAKRAAEQALGRLKQGGLTVEIDSAITSVSSSDVGNGPADHEGIDSCI